MKKAWMPILALAILVVVLLSSSGRQAPPELKDHGPAPDFSLQDLNGETVTLSELKGKVVFVNLWATWCVYCAKEIPVLKELHRDYEEEGLVILGVSVDEDPTNVVEAFVQKHDMTYPVLHDRELVLARAYNLGQQTGIPLTLVIDRRGHLRGVMTGFHPRKVQEPIVQRLLAEPVEGAQPADGA